MLTSVPANNRQLIEIDHYGERLIGCIDYPPHSGARDAFA